MNQPAPASPEWTTTHKGVVITLLSNGKFEAVMNRKRITRTSVDAIKKEIDKAQTFDSFKALHSQYSTLRELTIVGTKKILGRYRKGELEWVASNGVTYYEVYDDTPENRAALTAAFALRTKNEELASKLRREASEAMAAIKTRKAGAA